MHNKNNPRKKFKNKEEFAQSKNLESFFSCFLSTYLLHGSNYFTQNKSNYWNVPRRDRGREREREREGKKNDFIHSFSKFKEEHFFFFLFSNFSSSDIYWGLVFGQAKTNKGAHTGLDWYTSLVSTHRWHFYRMLSSTIGG